MTQPSAVRPVHPSMALAAYLERLVRGRRVAVLGDVTLAFGERLVDRGARLVHVYDPNPVRVAEVLARTADHRDRHITHAVLEGDLGVRDGAFDVVVIPDLTLFDETTAALRKMRRLVGNTGVAVIACANEEASRRLLDKRSSNKPSTTDYYGLYDLVSLQFPVVRMLGQAPFVGYTLADFGASGELEVSVDTSLLETTEEPEIFIAIASERKLSLDPFVVVELGLGDVRKSLGPTTAVVDPAVQAAQAEAAAKEAAERAAERAARDEAHRVALEEQKARAEQAEARAADLEQKLEKLREVEARAGDTHVRAERLTHQIRDLEEELFKQRERGTKLAKQLDDEKKARTKAEVELGLSRGPKDAPGAKERIEQLTQEVGSVRSRAMELEGELAAAEIGINDLVSDRADLRERVEDLERRLADAKSKPNPAFLDKLHQVETDLAKVREEKRAVEKNFEASAATKQERDRLAETNADLEKRVSEFGAEREALVADMEALEGRLRERGQRIATLEAELREGLRVGKELLGELEEARTQASSTNSSGGPGTSSASNGSGSQTPPGRASSPMHAAAVVEAPEIPNSVSMQLDALAARAARAEADLETARWRITQLEHAGIGFDREEIEPAAIAVELEQALLASQQELATLRRTAGPEGSHVPAGVIEQAVLLHQVASQTEAFG